MGLISIIIASSCSRPINHYNIKASLVTTDQLDNNLLEENVMASLVNVKEHSMSTLYGNSIAFAYARDLGDEHYPKDAKLYLVTWDQQEDSLWFGANIPASIRSIEVVAFHENTEGQVLPVYSLYNGKALRKEDRQDEVQVRDRIRAIVQERMAVSP